MERRAVAEEAVPQEVFGICYYHLQNVLLRLPKHLYTPY